MNSPPSPPHNSLTYQFPLSAERNSIIGDEIDSEELSSSPSSPPSSYYYTLPTVTHASNHGRTVSSTVKARKGGYNQYPRVVLERKNSTFLDERHYDSEEEEEYEEELREKEDRKVESFRSNKCSTTHSYRNFNNIPARSKPSSPPPSSSTPQKSGLTLRSSTSLPLTTSNNTSWTLAETRILKDAVKYANDNSIMSWKNIVVIMGRNKEGIKILKTSEQVCNKFWKLRGKGEVDIDDNAIPTEFETMDFLTPTAVDKEEQSTSSKSKRRISFSDDAVPMKVQKSHDDSSTPISNSSSYIPHHPINSTPIPLFNPASSTSSSYLMPTVKKRTAPKPWSAAEVSKLTRIIHSFNCRDNGGVEVDDQGRTRTWELVSNLMGDYNRNSGMCCTKWNSLMRDERVRNEEEKWEKVGEGEVNEFEQDQLDEDIVHQPSPALTSTSTSFITAPKRINKRWTPSEITSLTSIVNAYDTSSKPRLWKNIASELNSGRTAGQCSDKWRGITNKRNGVVRERGGGARRVSVGSSSGGGGNGRSGSGRKRVKKEFTDFSSGDSEGSGEEEFESDEEVDQLE